MALRCACLVLVAALVGFGVALAAAEPEKTPAPAQKEAAAVKGPRNLIPNGDFEEGKDTPTGWQTVDGLTTFWEKDSDPAHGKVIRFDTDVYQSQGYDWWVKIAQGAKALDAPKKTMTVGDKYDTLAGNDGVWFFSDFIPVEKGKAYWLSLDAKGPGMMVWLMGYPEKTSTAFGADEGAFQEVLQEKITGKPRPKGRNHEPFIHKYVWKGQLTVGASDTWKTFSRRAKPFRPTAVTPNVRFVRVLLLPFWPPGTYYVDNVTLTEVEDKEGAAPEK